MITAIPDAVDMKPGSAALPFFGVVPKVIGTDGAETAPGEAGSLVVTRPWPDMMQGVYGSSEAFKNAYFPIAGSYLTGDGAYRDEDGCFLITGRIDDVVNVSGHRIGTAEIESALVSCSRVAEAAVVGYPHPSKGAGIYAYVTVKEGTVIDEELRSDLRDQVREVIGPIATPDVIHFAKSLPKTRSGKVMRRILRKIAAQEHEDLSDLSTLSEPSVVAELIHEMKRISAWHRGFARCPVPSRPPVSHSWRCGRLRTSGAPRCVAAASAYAPMPAASFLASTSTERCSR